MKRIISLILCVVMVLSLETAAFGADEIAIYVNGEIVESELKPVIDNGNTLIPMRPVAEAMGYEVTWVPDEKGIVIESKVATIHMVIDYNVIYTKANSGSDTVAQELAVPPQIINDSTYIPLRAMVEALGGEVIWEADTKTIYITYDETTGKDSQISHIGNTETESNYESYGKVISGDEESGSYIGEISNGKANGNGTMTWDNGDVYVGEFKDGYRHGTGTYTWASGDVYEGQWVYGHMDGYGEIAAADGESYKGEFKDGYRNGTGTYIWSDGSVYEGEWENDEMSGYGVFTLSNGDKYEGEWKNSNYNGTGTYTRADGTVFEGTWVNGKLTG